MREQAEKEADPEVPEAEEAAVEAAGDVEPAVKVAEPAEEKAEASLQERGPFSLVMAALSRLRLRSKRQRSGSPGSGCSRPAVSGELGRRSAALPQDLR